VLSLIFAIFLAVSPVDQSVCDRNTLNSDETLYKEILLSSKDSSVKLKYLQKLGNCIDSEGISLTEIRNIPVLEILDCKNPLNEKGSEVFFNKGKLCSRSVQFFPSRSVFTINIPLPVISINEKWQSVQGHDMVLFFNKSATFSQLQDPEGRILSKKGDSFFTDSIGKSAHPYFVFESGIWKTAYPLKEFFELNVSAKNDFTAKMITESSIPYERERLIEITGLKASDIIVETPIPSNYFIKGTHLKGMRIPFLSLSKNGESFHGTYIFRLFYKGIGHKPFSPVEETDYSITMKNTADSKELTITVKSEDLSSDQINRITAVINKEIPLFHITKSDADK